MLTNPILSNSQIITSTKDVLSTSCLVEAFKEGFNQKCTNINKLNHLSQATCLVYKMRSLWMRCLTLDSCHYFGLTIRSLRSIQIVQGVILQRRCQIFIFLMYILWILSPKRPCCQWKLSKLPIQTPHNPYMMRVAPYQVFRAWMQSQSLCLTYVLVLGSQETHWLHMEAGAMHALYSLTKTT